MAFGWFLSRVLVATVALGVTPVQADERAHLAQTTCTVLDQAVIANPGGPLLLSSYPAWQGQLPPIEALRHVAFTYDNALASIALFACGKTDSARRIADALVLATVNDPQYRDGRVRNAYASGLVDTSVMKLPGYWSQERNAWNQDAYQVSSATGNEAWAALALLQAYSHTRHMPYLTAAKRVLEWTASTTLGNASPTGFVGGFFGYPPTPARQNWKSTEHNIDLAAAWTALDRVEPDANARAQAMIARNFVNSQWDAEQGRFLIGTGADGQTSDRERSGLDASVWPLIALSDPPADWMRVLTFVDQAHGIAGGYGFNRHPDGLWTEGTAQVAAVSVLRGLPERAAPLWPILKAQQTDQGWLFATPLPQIGTGLAIGPDSVTNDFFYYHLPHLGATAWAALAAIGANPFIPSPPM